MTNQPTNHAAHQPQDEPLTTEQVLVEEARVIPCPGQPLPDEHGHVGRRSHQSIGVEGDAGDADTCRETASEQHELYQALNRLDRAALCLSGGGIRSAAFSLGVIQALATHPRPQSPHAMFAAAAPATPPAAEGAAPAAPGRTAAAAKAQTGITSAPSEVVADPERSLLTQMQYLSTVSGGGYIGSWLSAWRSRAKLDAVWANLVGRPCGPDIEPRTIAWLRAYSNYLTPKLGALSGDTWAGVAIALRNLLLNWLVIVPAICVVILLLKIIAAVSIGVAVLPPDPWAVVLFVASAAVLLIITFGFVTRNRPSLRGDEPRDKLGRPLGVDQSTFQRWSLLPATLASGALIQLAASNSGLWFGDQVGKWIFVIATLGGVIVYALGWLLACLARREWRDFWLWTASGVVYGFLLGVGAYVYGRAPHDGFLLFNDLLLPVMFGVPWVLLSQMIAEMIFVGLSSYQRNFDAARDAATATPTPPGREVGVQDDSESDREWLGRAAGWYLVTGLGWLVVTFLVFAGSLLVQDLAYHIKTYVATLGGIGGIVTAIVGQSVKSGGRGATAEQGAKPLPTSIILAIAAPVFAAALIILLSGALDELLLGDSLVILLRYPGVEIVVPHWRTSLGVLVAGLIVAGVLLWIITRLREWFVPIMRPRWWAYIVIGPIFATLVVIFVPVAGDVLGAWLGIATLHDPWHLTTAEAWETTVPVFFGLVITGAGAYAAKRTLKPSAFHIFAVALPIVALAAIIFVAAVLAALEFWGAISLESPGLAIFSRGWFVLVSPLLVAFVGAAVLTWGASSCININRFSLHAVYRNRLVRAFLGSSRASRNPDAFSGFDDDDNPAMSSLWPPPQRHGGSKIVEWGPFHVINIALNIVSTNHLSWQQRKAESFTVSPLHSGSACKAYRRSDSYGGKKGISLGTAMAISGAAASPNMGYHSSPGITFLLALFNVRLGWWLGNPGTEGQETYRDAGPNFALGPLIQETFGLTTDEKPYVYLSDGGHFENLGLYEMVRRRCRYIVAVDAGCDPDYGFEDLGNAVRKIAIDLGVKIRFHGLDKLKKRDPKCPILGADVPYHAVGEIDYPASDGAAEYGTILYIKPGYHGVENADICAYAIANPEFPHQGTGNQFFTESQFESYRALGFEITDGILTKLLKRVPDRTTAGLREIFKQLQAETRGP